MRYPRLFLFITLSATMTSAAFRLPQPALAQDGEPPAATVEARVEDLDQQLRILERRLELERETVTEKAKTTPTVTAGTGGFSLKSANGDFQFRLRGYLQSDGRFFSKDPPQSSTNTFLLRRVRPIFESTVSKYYDFRIMPDFGEGKTVLQDTYLDIHYRPYIRLRVGKFKPPVGLERLQSGTDILFVERAFPTNLVPNRDVGVQVYGDLGGGVFSYTLGLFNGVPDGGSGDTDLNDDKDVAGRLFAHPFKGTSVNPLQGLSIGVSGTFGRQAGTLPSFKTPGQLTFFAYHSGAAATNGRTRVSPQAYYYWGRFGVQGEYVFSSQAVKKGTASAKLGHTAWQVASSYVLTGEKVSYKSVLPKRPFDPQAGTWGLWSWRPATAGFGWMRTLSPFSRTHKLLRNRPARGQSVSTGTSIPTSDSWSTMSRLSLRVEGPEAIGRVRRSF